MAGVAGIRADRVRAHEREPQWEVGTLPAPAAGAARHGENLRTDLRALEGYRSALGRSTEPLDHSLSGQAKADAPVNAYNAMTRADLSPEQAREARTVITRLGHEM